MEKVNVGSLQSLEDLQLLNCAGDPFNRVEDQVEVPNTEFVALIVGRNGHKIKAIRERTDTFIKTPLRNEPPVFKVAGSVQNVARAKKEIMEIVQRLKSPQYHRMGAMLGEDSGGEQRVTSSVRVPFKFVGLVVGFQGSTIMEIQMKTKTHIQTPAHGGEPIFLITGEPKNVWIAKLMIQFYIEFRTGLRVLEMDSLLEEAIDPEFIKTVLQVLYNYGVSETISLLMSRIDLPHDYPTDGNTQDQVPWEVLKPQHVPLQYSPVQQQSRPDKEEFFFPSGQSYATHSQLPTTMKNDLQLLPTTPTELHAITYNTINSLFPENTVPAAEHHQHLNAGFWWDSQTPSPLASPKQLHEQSFVLNESFWDYVANVNNLPPEQVL